MRKVDELKNKREKQLRQKELEKNKGKKMPFQNKFNLSTLTLEKQV